MANKSRKKNETRVGFPGLLVVMCLTAAGLGLCYVWLDSKNEALGARIKRLEQQESDLKQRHEQALLKWEKLKSPSNIEQALERHQVAMIRPAEAQIIRLKDPESGFDASSSVVKAASARHLAQASTRSRGWVND